MTAAERYSVLRKCDAVILAVLCLLATVDLTLAFIFVGRLLMLNFDVLWLLVLTVCIACATSLLLLLGVLGRRVARGMRNALADSKPGDDAWHRWIEECPAAFDMIRCCSKRI